MNTETVQAEHTSSRTFLLWLKLGRVSNLPTVWTNVFTGIALSTTLSASLNPAVIVIAVIAMSLAYLAGMFLNDVFDAQFDAEHNPHRPIPSGDLSVKSVMIAASGLLVLCLIETVFAAIVGGQSPWQAIFSAISLIGCIVLYNAWHKDNPYSPVIMGACRALVYFTAASVVSDHLALVVLGAAGLLMLYVVGLTYTARQEHLNQWTSAWPLLGLFAPIAYGAYLSWNTPLAVIPLLLLVASVGYSIWRLRRREPGDIGVAVVTLIAGIALIDAILLFAHGFPALGIIAISFWLLTLALQNWVSGT